MENINAQGILPDETFHVRNDQVMNSSIDVLTKIGKTGKVILQARGNMIPNAVAIANIVTEKILKGNSKIDHIKVDSFISEKDGRMVSTIEIILLKI